MNDPHVVALRYKVEHASSIDYSSAAPLVVHEDGFDVRVEDRRVRFSMKAHFATERDARDAVDDYICSWELDAALAKGPNAFKLRFDRAEIEDRNPTPSTKDVDVRVGPVRTGIPRVRIRAIVSSHTYPKPPSTGLKRSPDVESMFYRYVGYREGREPLTTMAYFCLTVLLASTRERRGQLKVAAERYRICQPVLKRLTDLSSTKGGVGARKAKGVHQDLTQQESQFLEEAVKTIIRRVAEVAHHPEARLEQITMRDLPRI